MPAARQASRSPGSALAVMAMIRGWAATGHLLADAAGGFQPIQLGHLHIHQHHIVRLPCQRVERFLTVGGHVGPVAQPRQHVQRQFLVDRVVFGQQDAQRMAFGHMRIEGCARGVRPAARAGGLPTKMVEQGLYSCETLSGLVSTAAKSSV